METTQKTVLDKIRELNTPGELLDLSEHCAALGTKMQTSADINTRNIGWVLAKLALDLKRMAQEAVRP